VTKTAGAPAGQTDWLGWDRSRRRRAGWGLIAFGLVGLVLVGAAGALVLGSLTAVDAAVTGFERQRTEIVAMLGPASDALTGASESASHASASLAETSGAARNAADLTTRLAESFEDMASLGSFTILGARPFAEVAGQFAAVGVEARELSGDLNATADAMTTNIADSQAVAADLLALAEQLDRLKASLGTTGTPGGTDASLPLGIARLVLLGMLAWLAVPALASIWLGGGLIGRERRRARG
jgi:hypothetical protein